MSLGVIAISLHNGDMTAATTPTNSIADRPSPTDERPLAPAIQIGTVCVDPPVLAAPMAGFTNYAFRQVVRGFGGAGLISTEMVSARGFVWMDAERAEHPDRLWGVLDEPRPLAVQIWDNDPEMLALVGRRLACDYKVSVVDINFGCPVRRSDRKSGKWFVLAQDARPDGADHRASCRCLCPDAGHSEDPSRLHARYGQCGGRGPGCGGGRQPRRSPSMAARPRTCFAARPTGTGSPRSSPISNRIPLIGNGDLELGGTSCGSISSLPGRRRHDRPRLPWPPVALLAGAGRTPR